MERSDISCSRRLIVRPNLIPPDTFKERVVSYKAVWRDLSSHIYKTAKVSKLLQTILKYIVVPQNSFMADHVFFK